MCPWKVSGNDLEQECAPSRRSGIETAPEWGSQGSYSSEGRGRMLPVHTMRAFNRKDTQMIWKKTASHCSHKFRLESQMKLRLHLILQLTSSVTLYKLPDLSVPLFLHLWNGSDSTSITLFLWTLKEISTEFMLSFTEYYYEYYFYTSTDIVYCTNLSREASVDGPRQQVSLFPPTPQQSCMKHHLCAKESYHFHPGYQGAAQNWGAPLVNAQANTNFKLGLQFNTTIGGGVGKVKK